MFFLSNSSLVSDSLQHGIQLCYCIWYDITTWSSLRFPINRSTILVWCDLYRVLIILYLFEIILTKIMTLWRQSWNILWFFKSQSIFLQLKTTPNIVVESAGYGFMPNSMKGLYEILALHRICGEVNQFGTSKPRIAFGFCHIAPHLVMMEPKTLH